MRDINTSERSKRLMMKNKPVMITVEIITLKINKDIGATEQHH
ncbi:hypothetical protein [Methanolobus chelungpuianus]|nr:hypothetical protein [Methanolobus chelungpuianus]